MNKKTRISVCSALAAMITFAITLSARADTLYLRAGEQEQGKLKKMTANSVMFEGRSGEKTLAKPDVTRIQLQQARQWDDIETADQISDPDLKAVVQDHPSPTDFPADGYVTLLSRHTFDLTVPGVVKETHRTISEVLRQRGEDIASVNVYYFEDTDVPEVDFALTVTPDGHVLHLSDAALKNESLYAKLPDYRRLSRCRFAAKEPRPGSILDVQYTVVRKRDPIAEPFYVEALFRNKAPILRKEVTVIVPVQDEKAVSWRLEDPGQGAVWSKSDSDSVAMVRKVDGDLVRLTWRLVQPQQGIIEEPLMPPMKEYVPSLTLSESNTWEILGGMYAAALAALPPLPDLLKEKAVELAGQSGAAGIHDFIARTIRVAPIPFPSYRLVPHSAEDTFRRGVANSLDKNFLYYQMLNAAGIPCTFGLLRDRNRGPLCDEIPSLGAFSSSVVYIKQEKHFSDVASDMLSFDDLPGTFQGGKVLMISSSGSSIADVERLPLEAESETTDFDAVLDNDGNLDINMTVSVNGNAALVFRMLKQLNDENVRIEVQQLASSLHPAAILGNYTTTNLADLTVKPSITFDCRIPAYAVKAGDDLMMFNLPGVKFSAAEVGRPTREHGLFWNHKGRETIRGTVYLPAGFKIYSVPKKAEFHSTIADYKANIKKRNQKLVLTQIYDLKTEEAPAASYSEYKQSQELRADLSRQRVILVRKK